jgi:hypothetical protein
MIRKRVRTSLCYQNFCFYYIRNCSPYYWIICANQYQSTRNNLRLIATSIIMYNSLSSTLHCKHPALQAPCIASTLHCKHPALQAPCIASTLHSKHPALQAPRDRNTSDYIVYEQNYKKSRKS